MVVLSLMHVLFLGSERSMVMARWLGASHELVDEPLDLVTLLSKDTRCRWFYH